jgi:hypothetical protein
LREESLLVLCFDPRGILRFAQNDKPRDFFPNLSSLIFQHKQSHRDEELTFGSTGFSLWISCPRKTKPTG